MPAAALANAPLGIARNLSESGMEGAESTMPQSLQDQGFVERALLSEAAMRTVLNIPLDA